jgi:arginase family enzyme
LPKALALRQHDAEIPGYVHVDLDVLDPAEGRMNEFAAGGGLSAQDLHWCLELIFSCRFIRAASLTAYDPAADVSGDAGRSALRAVDSIVAAAAAHSNPRVRVR